MKMKSLLNYRLGLKLKIFWCLFINKKGMNKIY